MMSRKSSIASPDISEPTREEVEIESTTNAKGSRRPSTSSSTAKVTEPEKDTASEKSLRNDVKDMATKTILLSPAELPTNGTLGPRKTSATQPSDVHLEPVKDANHSVIPPLYTEPSKLFGGDMERSSEKKLKYPKAVFFIIVNEFCERFCFYGMRTILVLYFKYILDFDEELSTVLYHTFNMLCYFTPVLGAIIADNYLGKFKTILILSIVYACGCILLAVSAIPNGLPQAPFSLLGLFIIALGTGGIKPCVSAFGGDQFVRPQQDRQLEQFFSVFYFSINAGSFISTFVTPILREDVHCFGEDSCFSLAFGLPAILMTVAVIVFIIGRPLYKMKMPEGSILGDFARCIGRGLWRRITVKGEKHDHWLEYAADKYPKQLIEDTKRVLAVGFIFIPLPVFWTLYDQQGSRWTFQATRMNGDFGGYVLKPDQVQIINPILILILVPIFDAIVYPLFKKCGLLTPLQRICCGLIFCGLSFVVSGILEIQLEPTYAKIPPADKTQLQFINVLPCKVNFNYTVGEYHSDSIWLNTTNAERKYLQRDLEAWKDISLQATVDNPKACGLNGNASWSAKLGQGNGTQGYSVLFSSRKGSLAVFRMDDPDRIEKSDNGQPLLGFILDLDDFPDEEPHGAISIVSGSYNATFAFNTTNSTTPQTDNVVYIEPNHKGVELGTFDLYLELGSNQEMRVGKVENLMQGGVYNMIVQRRLVEGNETVSVLQVEVTSANTVNILWLIPQYFVVTVGEVMFSVTGLSFSFNEAPPSMKSVMQAMWLMIVAFGNLIVIIVESAGRLDSQAAEFFLFAGIMGVAAIVFTLLSFTYTYVDQDAEKKKRLSSDAASSRRDSVHSFPSSEEAMPERRTGFSPD